MAQLWVLWQVNGKRRWKVRVIGFDGGEERRDAETWRRQKIQQMRLTGWGTAVGTREKRERVHEDFWVWARGRESSWCSQGSPGCGGGWSKSPLRTVVLIAPPLKQLRTPSVPSEESCFIPKAQFSLHQGRSPLGWWALLQWSQQIQTCFWNLPVDPSLGHLYSTWFNELYAHWRIWMAKRMCLECRRCRFDHWVGKIPWRRKWQPIPAFLPGESHGQRSLVGCSLWGSQRAGHNLVTEQQKQN